MRRLLLVFVLLAAACGAERPTFESSGGMAREVGSTTVPQPETTPGTDVSGSLGQNSSPITVRLAIPGNWSGDPADAGPASISRRVLADLLFDGITTLNPSGMPVPALAERWVVSDDRREWTFVFAAGLTDAQGTRLTASDIAASLDRVAARGAADQSATALVAISGWHSRMTGDADAVSGLDVIDEWTLRLRLDRPFELLPTVLASPSFGIRVVRPDGGVGTTGPFRPTDDPTRLESVSPTSSVTSIELLLQDEDGMSLVADGSVDWAVVPPGEIVDDLPGDLLRVPLDLRVGFAVRLPDVSERLGLGALLDPVAIADGVAGLSALASIPVAGPSSLPDAVVIDAPEGRLAAVAAEATELLENAGVSVDLRLWSPEEFAAHVASGEAMIFPVTIAGGTGIGGAALRFFAPGGVDDIAGTDAQERSVLAALAGAEIDPDARSLALAELERLVIDAGIVRVVGRWEVTVSIGPRLTGLRQRPNGTLDLSRAALAPGR